MVTAAMNCFPLFVGEPTSSTRVRLPSGVSAGSLEDMIAERKKHALCIVLLGTVTLASGLLEMDGLKALGAVVLGLWMQNY